MANNYIEDSISYVEEIEDLFEYMYGESNRLKKISRELVGFSKLLEYSLEEDNRKYSKIE